MIKNIFPRACPAYSTIYLAVCACVCACVLLGGRRGGVFVHYTYSLACQDMLRMASVLSKLANNIQVVCFQNGCGFYIFSILG